MTKNPLPRHYSQCYEKRFRKRFFQTSKAPGTVVHKEEMPSMETPCGERDKVDRLRESCNHSEDRGIT